MMEELAKIQAKIIVESTKSEPDYEKIRELSDKKDQLFYSTFGVSTSSEESDSE